MLGNKSVIRCAILWQPIPLKSYYSPAVYPCSLDSLPTHQLNCLLTVPDIYLDCSEGPLLGGNRRAACAGFLAKKFGSSGEEETRQGSRDGQLYTQLCHISAALLAAVRGKGR